MGKFKPGDEVYIKNRLPNIKIFIVISIKRADFLFKECYPSTQTHEVIARSKPNKIVFMESSLGHTQNYAFWRYEKQLAKVTPAIKLLFQESSKNDSN